jgi:hypothetical protein
MFELEIRLADAGRCVIAGVEGSGASEEDRDDGIPGQQSVVALSATAASQEARCA